MRAFNCLAGAGWRPVPGFVSASSSWDLSNYKGLMLLVKRKPPLQRALGYTVCWMGLTRGPTADRPGETLRISHGRHWWVHPPSPGLPTAVTTTPGGTVLLAQGLRSWGIWVTAHGDLELCR